ncbi:hypothetical protein [Mesorhizobium sp.]|uniref:hypothetical protein n=1 Tax=Mesorhizobium sp. TaxID=1871066 RepID=UPI001205A26C|nr:hypothetical protein [Mesorhizobium sp.]TIN79326.1 MAG: hypothetical protein E5Y09_07800 [Mesorhizobium sp.]
MTSGMHQPTRSKCVGCDTFGDRPLTQDLKFEKPFILHIANDRAGEPVTIGTQVAAGAKTDLGTLQPGECLSVSVNEISGVYADCALDSIVHCLIY